MPAPLEEPSLASLSTLSALQVSLSQTDKTTESLEKSLEAYIQHTTATSTTRAQALSTISQLAASVSQDADALSSHLQHGATTAKRSIARIRDIDKHLTRANEALSWADDILTLRVCAEGAKTSLSADDYESAAAHVKTYLQLGEGVKNDTASATAVSQMEQSRAELERKIRARTTETFEQLQTPEKAVDTVKLYVPIGHSADGLQVLTDHLRLGIARESDADVRSLLIDGKSDAQGADEKHMVAFARLFESVAGVVHEILPSVQELFGGDGITVIVEGLQKECDSCAGRIFERYNEARTIDEVLRSIKSETANARDLDALLNEITLFSQRLSAYFQFLEEKSDGIGEVLEKSALHRRRGEVAEWYNSMEGYFMRENARLAIKIDESNGEDADTSTTVDDFFFVMQKCFQRAFAFGDTQADVLNFVLQQVSSCLMNDLLAYLRRRLRETEAALEKLFGGSASTSTLPAAALTVSYLTELAKANITIPGGSEEVTQESDVAKYDFFIALNNAAVSAEYATRFRGKVEKAVQASPKLSMDDSAVLAAPIAQITDAARALLLAAEHGVSRLATVLLGRVTPVVEASLRDASYVVTEAQYSLDSGATPSFSREVAQEIETKVLSNSLEKRLTEKNWDALVRQVAEWFAHKIESLVFLPPATSPATPKPFNAFGGLRADRDVRAISAYFSGKSRRSTVRDVFGRLSQLAMVVNLERPAEVYDIWGPNAGGMTWRLSSTEVRRTLSLRNDFSQDAIRSLKL